jgi:phosphatidylglycerophosphate synthase
VNVVDLRLRPVKDRALDPATRLLAGRVNAGTLTAGSLALAAATAIAAWASWPVVAVACWWASRLLDGLDGPVARARGEASDLGGYVDMIADTIGYAFIPVGVALGVDQRAAWIAVAVLLAVLFVNAISCRTLRPCSRNATSARVTVAR